MTIINVQVYSDTVCPWCYIGEKSFSRAVDLYRKTYPGGSQDKIQIEWLPYYLNANASETGVTQIEQIAVKNGAERVNAITTRLSRVGREYGIIFDFLGKFGKTKDSHRLILFAGTKRREVQEALVSEIFRMHFEERANITSHEDLAKAAVAVGMSESEAMTLLQSDEFGDEVDRKAAEARADGISSVPTYVIGQRKIEGAESVSDFLEALIAAKTAPKNSRRETKSTKLNAIESIAEE